MSPILESVHVTIFRGENLLGCEYLTGKSDPYCSICPIRAEDLKRMRNYKLSTYIVKRNLNPVWVDQHFVYGKDAVGKGEKYGFAIDVSGMAALRVTVKNKNSLRSVDMMGQVCSYTFILFKM